MDVAQIAATGVASQMALTQQSASLAIVKTAAQAQMQMANMIAQQATQVNPQEGFSVYA